MRNAQLHAALAAFAEEAAWQLAADTSSGAEVPFEVIEARGARRDLPLYCYRPLTGDFIERRQGMLSRLEAYLPALHALGQAGGLDAYLELRVARGVPRDLRQKAELALLAFLGRVFEESTDFELTPERFDRAYGELEAVVCEGRTECVVVVPVLGLDLEADEVPMGDGLVLVRGDAFREDPPREAVWPHGASGTAVLAVLRSEAIPGDESPLDGARLKLGRLLTALRLFDEAGAALGPAAFVRTGGGPWQAAAHGVLHSGGHPRGVVELDLDSEDELRAFCSLVGRRTPRSGEVAWALRRFAAGCAQARPDDALTDHLLALRALLEPEGPASGRLAGRLAAVCAEPHERARTAERLAHLSALERSLVTGAGRPDAATVTALAREIEGHLRAILRDVLCGHLDADVRAVADRLLAEQPAEHTTLH